MQDWFDVAKKIDSLVQEAAASAGLEDTFSAEIRSADPRFGDLQANGALPYAKRAKTNPRQIAQALVAKLQENEELSDKADISIAGPGFINFKFKPSFQLAWLSTFRDGESFRAAAGTLNSGEKVVVDYGSPNTAKQMHVGHIRSIVIGEAICRLLEFCGAEVVRDNHIGDWGTPYGKLFYAYKRHLDEAALEKDPLEELERLYKLGSKLADDEKVLEECRQELVDLQAGKPESIELWEKVNALSIQGLETIYKELDVNYDCYLGESFYRDKVEQVYQELNDAGLSEESKGAVVVFHPEHSRFAKQPFIIRKSDGASNYATTDLATMLYRTEHFKATSVVIVTDDRQKDHFEQLDLTTQKWFEKTGRTMPKFSHVMFGKINGEDGKVIKSRSGDPIRLRQLIDEAVERAAKIVREKNSSLSEEELAHISQVIGVSAIKYADLSNNRTSDYIFTWDKLLSFEGNTAPYLLYAAARIQSIFRKLDDSQLQDLESKASEFETAEEIALANKIISFVGVLQSTIEQLRPHLLCSYLFELSGAYSSFYSANKVIVPEVDVQSRRLLLCQRTLVVLQSGLKLLGIPTLSRM
ncbi:arginine--tRNA ligase [Pelagicoccus albus]|uniref:Arginine--tRNA ligase n=1 Tax=Pelagicoccus albus TaxID=415222 RepID=A0A7X1B9K5_9BACT|nr:arginine--tRNA ligase [Pelagicoccus albus]MBC2608216.1 arginine--tRNA ligase [Pelagicoccus albus]